MWMFPPPDGVYNHYCRVPSTRTHCETASMGFLNRNRKKGGDSSEWKKLHVAEEVPETAALAEMRVATGECNKREQGRKRNELKD